MAYIKLELDHPIQDGESLTFKAPCDCTAATDGIKVYYPAVSDTGSTTTYKTFAIKDAHGNTITTLSNLFKSGAYVKIIVNTTNNHAYIQNADTNKYLEDKFDTKLVAPTSNPTQNKSILCKNTSGNPYWVKPSLVCDNIGAVIKSDTGWLQYDPTTYPSCWYRVANDVVYVRGFSSATTPLTPNSYKKIGYITSNYWADEELYFSANSMGGGKQIDGMIDTEGNVKLYSSDGTSYWAFTFSYPIA